MVEFIRVKSFLSSGYITFKSGSVYLQPYRIEFDATVPHHHQL